MSDYICEKCNKYYNTNKHYICDFCGFKNDYKFLMKSIKDFNSLDATQLTFIETINKERLIEIILLQNNMMKYLRETYIDS